MEYITSPNHSLKYFIHLAHLASRQSHFINLMKRSLIALLTPIIHNLAALTALKSVPVRADSSAPSMSNIQMSMCLIPSSCSKDLTVTHCTVGRSSMLTFLLYIYMYGQGSIAFRIMTLIIKVSMTVSL